MNNEEVISHMFHCPIDYLLEKLDLLSLLSFIVVLILFMKINQRIFNCIIRFITLLSQVAQLIQHLASSHHGQS